MKVSEHFYLQEFLPEEVFDYFKNDGIWLLDRKIIDLAQLIRERAKRPITINNWMDDGKFQERGFRSYNSNVGVRFSQHRFGRAIDFSATNLLQIYTDITKNFSEYKKAGLTTVENIGNTLKWIHCDTRYTGLESLLIIKP